jgi:hypothetical protein
MHAYGGRVANQRQAGGLQRAKAQADEHGGRNRYRRAEACSVFCVSICTFVLVKQVN